MEKLLKNKSAIIFTLFCMIIFVISSCKKNTVSETIVYGDANIRITNTVLGSNAQDFYQDDTKITTVAVAYGETSPSLKLKAGTSIISLKSIGTTTATISANTLFETNLNYTFFYYTNSGGAAQFNGLIDNNVVPATGKIKIRFVNLGAAFNNTLNIGITGGAALVTGIGFANATDYYTIDASRDLDVTVLNSGITGNIPGTNFVSGKIYTVWFDAATSTTAKFHVIQQN